VADSVGMAMVGCGQIAEAHLKAIGRVEGAELVYTADVLEERAQKAAVTYGAPHWTTAYEQVLDDPAVDAVILCLPHHLHKSFTVEALAASKHVLVEKPMALSEEEAVEMVAEADRSGKFLSVGQSTRFMPTYQKAKALLDEGGIGEVVNVLHQRMFWLEKLSTEWRRNLSECGGMYLPIFGSHDVDAILWLLNDQPEKVWGSVRAASPVTEGDSDGFIGLEFADGKIASIAFATRCRHQRAETVLAGREGTLVVDRNEVKLDGEAIDLGDAPDSFTLQMREFMNALLEEKQPPASGKEVLKVVRTLDLVARSSDQGRVMAF
jgi:predicted dehydrogenase